MRGFPCKPVAIGTRVLKGGKMQEQERHIYSHAQIHTHTYTHAHAHASACTHTCFIHMHLHARTSACTFTHAYTHAQMQMQTHTRIHLHMHTCNCIHTHTYTCTCTYSHMHTYISMHTYEHTRTYITYTRMYTDTRTTHTHTQIDLMKFGRRGRGGEKRMSGEGLRGGGGFTKPSLYWKIQTYTLKTIDEKVLCSKSWTSSSKHYSPTFKFWVTKVRLCNQSSFSELQTLWQIISEEVQFFMYCLYGFIHD